MLDSYAQLHLILRTLVEAGPLSRCRRSIPKGSLYQGSSDLLSKWILFLKWNGYRGGEWILFQKEMVTGGWDGTLIICTDVFSCGRRMEWSPIIKANSSYNGSLFWMEITYIKGRLPPGLGSIIRLYAYVFAPQINNILPQGLGICPAEWTYITPT